MTILIATTALYKAREIAALLADLPGIQLENLGDYPATEAPDEDQDTMAGNARLKAGFYAAHFGKVVLADDSGLEVDALNGEPGVHSARWMEGSDADRNRALLDKMSEVEIENRGARYRCALCLASPTEIICETEATCEGAIALLSEGFGGFGYDPIFQITLATGADAKFVGQTLAQAPPEVKASVSHRAGAVRLLAEKLKSQAELGS